MTDLFFVFFQIFSFFRCYIQKRRQETKNHIWQFWISKSFGQRRIWKSDFMSRKIVQLFICHENSEEKIHQIKGTQRSWTYFLWKKSASKIKTSICSFIKIFIYYSREIMFSHWVCQWWRYVFSSEKIPMPFWRCHQILFCRNLLCSELFTPKRNNLSRSETWKCPFGFKWTYQSGWFWNVQGRYFPGNKVVYWI